LVHQYAEHEKFAKSLYPDGSSWGRKGFLKTTWRINGHILSMVNLHNFHDASNIKALMESPSVFCANRQRSLRYVLDRCGIVGNRETDGLQFLFGDFNFRLTMQQLMEEIYRAVIDVKKTEKHDEGNNIEEIQFYGTSASGAVYRVNVGSKKFEMSSAVEELFDSEWRKFRQLDEEPIAVENELFEFDFDYKPTYCFGGLKGDGFTEAYSMTRCPAWTDRILMTKAASELASRSGPYYNSPIETRGRWIGDHRPVLLTFALPGASS